MLHMDDLKYLYELSLKMQIIKKEKQIPRKIHNYNLVNKSKPLKLTKIFTSTSKIKMVPQTSPTFQMAPPMAPLMAL